LAGEVVVVKLNNFFGLVIWFLARVLIGWALFESGGGGGIGIVGLICGGVCEGVEFVEVVWSRVCVDGDDDEGEEDEFVGLFDCGLKWELVSWGFGPV